MINIELWDKESSLILPSGREITAPEIFAEFPISRYDGVVLEYLPGQDVIVGALDGLGVLRDRLGIADGFSDTEALAEIQRIRNAPPEPVADEQMPLTRGDMQLLEQHLTELELTILEVNADV